MKQKRARALKMEVLCGYYCTCGKKAPFQDSNKDNLYTGDVVTLIDKRTKRVYGRRSVVEYENKIFVMGIESDCPNYEKEWEIYKEKSYMSTKEGDVIGGVVYYEEAQKEMTVAEIEKELGYSIKIIKEEN